MQRLYSKFILVVAALAATYSYAGSRNQDDEIINLTFSGNVEGYNVSGQLEGWVDWEAEGTFGSETLYFDDFGDPVVTKREGSGVALKGYDKYVTETKKLAGHDAHLELYDYCAAQPRAVSGGAGGTGDFEFDKPTLYDCGHSSYRLFIIWHSSSYELKVTEN